MYEICPMSMLITAATEMELEPFLKRYPSADYLITGVGAPMAMYSLLHQVGQIEYSFILQVGIAGTFSTSLNIGEVVLVQQDCFADIGVMENKAFKSAFDLGFNNRHQFPFQDGWLINEGPIISDSSLKKAKGLTVNLLTDDKSYINQINMKYDAALESMEGAAFHYVCLQQHIPFLQIRGISNEVGERDKSKWKIKEAIAASNDTLMDIYELLQSK